ncbi:MAG: hypothetical protein Q4E26_01120 [Prevotellaceae bacterium]|nr:hypothetical protein [Prevotellaceae bacterium]
MGKIREFIKKLTPHGIIMRRNTNTFLQDYDRWKAAGGSITFDKTCRFDSYVTIDGFGSSGSSAVMDLLREYDGCTVWATKPSFTGKGTEVKGERLEVGGEMDLMRLHGGLLYLEKMMEDDATVNVFWSDAAVKAFISLAFYSDQYKFQPELRPLFYGFFERIVDQRLTSDQLLMGAYLNPFSSLKDMFYLKRMPKSEYQQLCREFLYTLFNRLFPNAKGGCLVLDHIFDDCGLDMQRFQPYLPGVKRIKVRRDIRGVYIDAVKNNHRWLAHDTTEDFLKWERFSYRDHSDDNPTYHTVKFEELVSNYDYEVSRIEAYLDLKPEQHTRKGTMLKPEISCKNIRIWERYPQLAKELEEIRNAEPELCYTN